MTQKIGAVHAAIRTAAMFSKSASASQQKRLANAGQNPSKGERAKVRI